MSDTVTDCPQDVITNRAHYQCPLCKVDMTIAGRYDKSDRTVEGASKNAQFQCHGCNAVVTPQHKS